jgi:hypothetical protein
MRIDRPSVYVVLLASSLSVWGCSSDSDGDGAAAGGGGQGSGSASTGAGAGAIGGAASVGAGSAVGGAGGGASVGAGGAGGHGGAAAGGTGSGGDGGASIGGASNGGSASGGSGGIGGDSGGGGGSTSASGGGSDAGGSGAGGDSTSATGAGGGSTSTGGAGGGPVCVPGPTQCTDCVDNDGDGTFDAFDVECVGPLDQDEASFSTGIPGDNSDPCKQDCFFDGNSGAGDDGCNWNLKCDPASPGAPSCPYDAGFNNCPVAQSQKCIDTCQQYTPNGCDCFGCCDVTLSGGQTVTIKLGGGCTEEAATDPTACKACTKTTSCNNTCETCEYCLGKTELPPECFPSGSGGAGAGGSGSSSGGGGDGGGGPTCSAGVQVCTVTMPCPDGAYCLTGCCVPIPE